jgi:chromosome segregation ATPase
MIRLSGVVNLQAIGSLKKEASQPEEVELSETSESLAEEDGATYTATATKLAAKKSWTDANKVVKTATGTDQKQAARQVAINKKQDYLDAQKRALQSKTSTVKEVNTSLRDIVGRLDEMPDNIADSDTPPADTNDDGEGYMAKAQLMSLNKQSGELYNMLGDDEELEAWIQSKITKAADYINAAYNYLQYEKNKANTIGNGEGAPADPSATMDNLKESRNLSKQAKLNYKEFWKW